MRLAITVTLLALLQAAPLPVSVQKDRFDYIYIGASLCLTLITLVIAWTAFRQARAALLNAQAVINAERPWLVVTWKSDGETPGLYRFGCRNKGNTPGTILSMSASHRFVDKPENLPKPPDYSTPTTLPDLRLIVHKDSFRIEHGVNPQSVIHGAGKEALIGQSREFLVYYGNVVYRDMLYPDSSPEGLHETRWCFVFLPHGSKWVRSGPTEYNQYT